jgi:ATP/maltotriose-dependent transcriptional regulator MalT
MGATESLAHARQAASERSWRKAHDAFSAADPAADLSAEDLETWATTLLMLADDATAIDVLERAYDRYLEREETLRAVRAAVWIGINLAYGGAIGPASGWLARAQRLLDGYPEETAEHGYLMLPLVFQHEAAGEYELAAAIAGKAATLGHRFGDSDLLALAVHVQGHMLVMAGEVPAGVALLDEAMVTATTERLTPFVVGIVYCGVILACQAVFEVDRAREWTQVLSEWVAEQQELVAFTGRCLVHRAEILQLGGAWDAALEEARLAGRRFTQTSSPAAGLACYREAELLRLLGRFDAAERAYREASRMGVEPQPGLAQLRLAQGRVDAALAAVRRAGVELIEPLKRAALLPAHVEIAIAAGELDEARLACAELRSISGRYDSRMLAAMAAHAEGALDLAEGDPRSSLAALRRAQQLWLALDAPYEVARARLLLAQACEALDDWDAAARERDAARETFTQLGAAPDVERATSPAAGESHGLSARELEVLRLLARGSSNRDIAAQLVISEHTVARHVQNIYAKLRVSSRAAATAFAFEHDLI